MTDCVTGEKRSRVNETRRGGIQKGGGKGDLRKRKWCCFPERVRGKTRVTGTEKFRNLCLTILKGDSEENRVGVETNQKTRKEKRGAKRELCGDPLKGVCSFLPTTLPRCGGTREPKKKIEGGERKNRDG